MSDLEQSHVIEAQREIKPLSEIINTREIISVNLGPTPAFCLKYSKHVSKQTQIEIVNEFRSKGILCNLADEYIVGFIDTEEKLELVKERRYKFKEHKFNGLLGLAIPYEDSVIVINKKRNENVLGNNALVGAVRAIQTIELWEKKKRQNESLDDVQKRALQERTYCVAIDLLAPWGRRKRYNKNAPLDDSSEEEIKEKINLARNHTISKTNLDFINNYNTKFLIPDEYFFEEAVSIIDHDLKSSTKLIVNPLWDTIGHSLFVNYFNDIRNDIENSPYSGRFFLSIPAEVVSMSPTSESIKIIIIGNQKKDEILTYIENVFQKNFFKLLDNIKHSILGREADFNEIYFVTKDPENIIPIPGKTRVRMHVNKDENNRLTVLDTPSLVKIEPENGHLNGKEQENGNGYSNGASRRTVRNTN